MEYIQFFDVSKTYGYEKILNEVSFKICRGDKIGLIGNNGSGKTTLFKIILGIESYDKSKMGRVIIRNDIKIGYLEQETQAYGHMTIMEVMKSAFKEVAKALTEHDDLAESLKDLDGEELRIGLSELGRLQSYIETHHGYEIDNFINIVASGLGVDKDRYSSLMSELSGGERTRIFLAKLLLEEPDVLLLDEPSNHLDIFAVDWLERYIKNYKGTVIAISHDRSFLDNSVKTIFEIENAGLTVYNGNYTWYKNEKARRLEIQEKQYAKQQKEIKRLEKAAKQMREWARQADNEKMYQRAVNVEKRIEHMDKVEKPLGEYKSMNLSLGSTRKSGREIIRLEKLRKTFGERQLFDSIDLLVRNGEKVVISGENGSGKSTIINLLTGSLQPDGGKAIIGGGASYGLLPQEITFEDPERSILEEVRHELGTNAHTAQRLLASFGFKGEHVMKRVSELSGGEQKRLRLCTLMQHEYTLLIMDEPTNHMDIASREIIEKAVIDFKGTCLFVSHDRYFINKVCSRRLLLDDSVLREYEGDYSTLFDTARHQAKKKTSGKKVAKDNGLSKNRIRELEKLEANIHSVENRIESLNDSIQQTLGYEELSKMLGEKTLLEKQLSGLYEEWDKKS